MTYQENGPRGIHAMISRKGATTIGESYHAVFSAHTFVYKDNLYEFLFNNDYAPWFCNQSKRLHGEGAVKEWIMKLHTGETQYKATPDWTWQQRERLGQRYLADLTEDMLKLIDKEYTRVPYGSSIADIRNSATAMRRQLELDGYVCRDGKLLFSEEDVLDTKEEAGILETLYRQLGLADADTALHHVRLSEDHYVAGRWDDAISNARKFFECTLSQIAVSHSQR